MEQYLEQKNYLQKNLDFSCSELINIDSCLSPKVSIIIPVYNKAKYLLSSYSSIKNQNFQDIELIYVDDGSTDNSVDIIHNFQRYDKRIKLFQNGKNRGTVYTRFVGSSQAQGKYIMYLDPDDLFCSSDIIKSAYETAEKYNAEIVHFKHVFGNLNELTEKITYIPTIYELVTDKNFLSEALFLPENSKKDIRSIVLWDKFYSKELVLKAYNFMGESYYTQHFRRYTDWILTFSIFSLANSYIGLDKYGYWNNKYQDSVSSNRYEIDEKGNFLKPDEAEKDLSDLLINQQYIFKLTEDSTRGKKIALNAFRRQTLELKEIFPHSKKYPLCLELINKFLCSEFISEKNKKFIRLNFLKQKY